MCPVEYLVMCGCGMQRQLEKRQAEESREVVQVSMIFKVQFRQSIFFHCFVVLKGF